LAAYNAANGTTFKHPLQAMSHDLLDGVITFNGTKMSGPSLTMTGMAGQYLTWAQTNVVSFASGTQIATINGLVAVEDLQVDDLVLTMDNGYLPVAWIGGRHLSRHHLALMPQLRPIGIRAGVMGDNLPETDLLVSPQHRMLVRSRLVRRMFHDGEVLVAAKHLVGLPGIEIALDQEEVRYWHFMFDGHQVVFANGAPTESLFAGKESLKSLQPGQRAELRAIFPELFGGDPAASARVPARRLIAGRQGRSFAERSANSGKPLLERI
jgi:hypothetical protein